MVTFIGFVVVLYFLVVAACKSPAWMMAQAKKPVITRETKGIDLFVYACLFLTVVVVFYGLLLHNCQDFTPWTRSVSVERMRVPHAVEFTGVETAWR